MTKIDKTIAKSEGTAINVITENNCNVDNTRKALSDVFKNVTMAQDAIKNLLPYVSNQEITHALHKQVEQYDVFVENLNSLCKNLNFRPTPAPKMSLMMASMGIKMKMIKNKSITHVAKIMLQGTLNGIIDLYRIIRQNEDMHPDAMLVAKKILRFEEGRLEEMKGWL